MSLLIVLAVGGALVQSPVAPETAAVSGQVLEDSSRTPIAGAQVTLFPLRSRPVNAAVPFRPLTATTEDRKSVV